ncbi:pregnancy zone protein-like [Tubulanus polymorphus]|uniref:pregnancy zone protein-like n=1 Tax=Tubulanus polymorphus TaxID=672921 RepID=UPI003DA66872
MMLTDSHQMLAVICAVFCGLSSLGVDAKSGFMMTAPHTFTEQKTEQLCFTFKDVNSDVTVKVTLQANQNEVATVSYNLIQGNLDTCKGFLVPQVTDSKIKNHFTLKVTVTTVSGYTFEKTAQLKEIRKAERLIFIQTDKNMYKPGQTVKFRILSTDPRALTPITDPIQEVFIKDPNGNRVRQWKNVVTQDGLGDFEFLLSEDPFLGTWQIHMKQGSQLRKEEFVVKEYVLPKFEVTLTTPSYILASDKMISGKVCAKYTYGKSVSGAVKITVQRENTVSKSKPFEITKLINDCVDFTVSTSSIETSVGYWPYISITADVTETATGVILNDTMTIAMKNQRYGDLIKKYIPGYFKPGLPYSAKGILTLPDGAPAPLKTIQVTVKDKENVIMDKPVLTDKEGAFFINIAKTEQKWKKLEIVIKVDETKDSGLTSYWKNIYVQNWFSSTGFAIEIMDIENTMKCGQTYPINITYTTHSDSKMKFYYQMWNKLGEMADNKVLEVHYPKQANAPTTVPTKPTYINNFQVDANVKAVISGGARVLVYTILTDGTVISASREFLVGPCFENQVSMKFSKEEVFPGEQVDIVLTAKPGSWCSVAAVDKSMYLMQDSKYLTQEQVVSYLDQFSLDNDKQNSIALPCKHDNKGRNKRTVLINNISYVYLDASSAFKESGLIFISDFVVITRPCDTSGWNNPEFGILEDGVAMRNPQAGAGSSKKTNTIAPNADIVTQQVRTYFPESWLWDLTKVVSDSKTLQSKAPDTITEWIGNSFCTNPTSGLGVSHNTKLKTFKPFFASFTLPYSVIRGEKVNILVTVFNYLTECLVIEVNLGSSTDFSVESGGTSVICVCANQQRSVSYWIVPKTLGRVKISFTATSTGKSGICSNEIPIKQVTGNGAFDAVERFLLVEPEGIEQFYSESSLICLDAQSTSYSSKITMPTPKNMVVDSDAAEVTVVGDVMGPALSGLDRLVRMPTGCGEQNMITLVPSIYVLNYLTAINQLEPKLQQKALSYMNIGYQRELNYRHDDGSFSAFGKSDASGSMWLSAFVVKSFGQSMKYITIDQEKLNETIQWIISKQTTSDGCFLKVGRVNHNEMQGGVGSVPSITAYVLISLLEVNKQMSNILHLSESVTKAVNCLTSAQIDETDAYIVSLITYAFSLHDPNGLVTKQYLNKLKKLAIVEGGLTHWERTKTATDPKPPTETWRRHRPAPSLEVEMTAYAMMALLNINLDNKGIEDSIPVVKWLTKQRNSIGGFSSTQDTVIALQALAKYGIKISTASLSLMITVQGQKSAKHDFTISTGNRLLLQKQEISIPDELMVSASGTGCALLQANAKLNVGEMSETDPPFTVIIAPDSAVKNRRRKRSTNDEITKFGRIAACVRYTKPGSSNMVIVEIKMVSGWQPVKESLQKLVTGTNEENGVKRVEIKNNLVYLYYNQMTGAKTCFSFNIEQVEKVELTKPQYIKVYDYYETDLNVAQNYTILSVAVVGSSTSLHQTSVFSFIIIFTTLYFYIFTN